MSSKINQNFCFCCGPMSHSNIRSVVPSSLFVFSIIYIFMDIVDLSGIPISGVVILHEYTIFELIFQIIIFSYSLFMIW